MTSNRDPESGFVALRGEGRLAYQIHGQNNGGVPLLLIRPLGGTMALWGEFRELLAREFRVISFDLRGTGQSSPDPAWPTTRDLAHDAIQLLARLGVPRAHVFGISLGGMIATWFALLAPMRVARLCMASTPVRGLALSATGLRRELGLAACFVRTRRNVEAKLVERILSSRFRAAHPEKVSEIERIVRAEPASRTELIKHALAGLLHDARADVARIHAPTLVLAGQRDTLLGMKPARALSDAIAGSRFESVVDSGHDLTLEQARVTARIVSEFLRA
jgi:pimeloyl-ACP methyl ester carboxylesterase